MMKYILLTVIVPIPEDFTPMIGITRIIKHKDTCQSFIEVLN